MIFNALREKQRKSYIHMTNRPIDSAYQKVDGPRAVQQQKPLPRRCIAGLGNLASLALMAAMALSCSLAEAAPLTITEIAPGVFAHQGQVEPMTLGNRGNIANIGFIVGDKSVAVVDTGGSVAEAQDLLETIRSTTDKPISHVILTHMHPDHIFGSAAFLRPDVAFVGHARLNAAIEARYSYYLEANRPILGEKLVRELSQAHVTLPVADRLDIDLGGRIISLRAWPLAHTDNDLTVLDQKTGVMFTGDLVFTTHTPSIDGSIRGWLKVLDEMARMPVSKIVPGHGAIGAPWPAAMQAEQRYLNVLVDDIKAALAANKTLAETVETAGRSEAGNWLLFDDYNKRNVTTAFAELEWE
ncbi:quinoprotein relay system zinc metallohydrolase 2 [Oryzibacter oryziterrae]|uniref:quinoprotein relay system zinc metallohydrolase 2 n=1 Tax=Oryzibacter oryziterrae TaxID=2766474 RepID=UPI001F4703CB|nr:quinoprotein relay system zinc metallohydrolase 2 [Oryzibacter oryziterrae]